MFSNFDAIRNARFQRCQCSIEGFNALHGLVSSPSVFGMRPIIAIRTVLGLEADWTKLVLVQIPDGRSKAEVVPVRFLLETGRIIMILAKKGCFHVAQLGNAD